MSTNDSTLGGEAQVNRELPAYQNHVTGLLPQTHSILRPAFAELATDLWGLARQTEHLLEISAENRSTITATRAAVDVLSENQQAMGGDVKKLMAKIDGVVSGLAEQTKKVDGLAEQMAILIELQKPHRDT